MNIFTSIAKRNILKTAQSSSSAQSSNRQTAHGGAANHRGVIVSSQIEENVIWDFISKYTPNDTTRFLRISHPKRISSLPKKDLGEKKIFYMKPLIVLFSHIGLNIYIQPKLLNILYIYKQFPNSSSPRTLVSQNGISRRSLPFSGKRR